MNTLQDRLDRNPERWDPQPGDRLVGEVIEITTRTSEYGPYPCVTVLTDDDREVEWHAWHAKARAEVERHDVQVRHKIGVQFVGERQGRNNVWKDFRLVSEDPTIGVGIGQPDDSDLLP